MDDPKFRKCPRCKGTGLEPMPGLGKHCTGCGGMGHIPLEGSEMEQQIDAKKASVIHSEDGHQLGMVTLWGDGHVTVCASEPAKEHGVCYTSKLPEGNKLYFMALAWFASMGHEVHDVEGG